MSENPEFFIKQAGALPYCLSGNQVNVVLITSRSSGEWIFPKGIIEPGDTPEITAVKEAFEEAGVIGKLTGATLGYFDQEKWGSVARVEIYPLLVDKLLDDWEESGTRDRLLMPLHQSRHILKPQFVALVDTLEKSLQC